MTTGRLAVAYRASDTFAYRANVGNGFRAPSLFERFSIFAPVTPLSPESSIGGEIGVDASFANSSFGATVFYTEIDDRIAFDGPGFAQVPGTTVTQGIELSADYIGYLTACRNPVMRCASTQRNRGRTAISPINGVEPRFSAPMRHAGPDCRRCPCQAGSR